VAALAGLVAHGGVAGALVEASIALVVILVLGMVWLRERKTPDESADRFESLTDEESMTSLE
jgi:hypothetical protein